MPLLPEIAAYLVSQGLGTLGTTLFLSRMADAQVPAFITALFEMPGTLGERVMESSGMLLERPGLEVIVRGGPGEYAAAAAHAHAVWVALTAVANMTLSGTHYVAIDSTASPQDIGPDDHNRPMISLTFIVTKEPS